MRSPTSHNPPPLVDLHTPRSSQLRTVLALGLSSSVILHLGLIWGISRWWRVPAPLEEPLEIVLVAPVEAVVSVPAPPPPIEIAPKPIIRQTSSPVLPTLSPSPIVAKQPIAIATVKATTRPKIAPNSKPKPVKLVAKSQPFSTPKQLKPGSPTSKLKAKSTPLPAIDVPVPIAPPASPPKSFSLPALPPPTTKPNPLPVKSPRSSKPIKSSTSARAIAQLQPALTPPPIDPTPMASTPLPIRSASIPLQPPLTTPTTSNPNQPKDRPRASNNPLSGTNTDRQVKSGGNSAVGGFMPTRGGSTKPATSGDDSAATTGVSTGNSSPQNGTGTGTGTNSGTGTGEGKTGDRPSSANGGGLQCIKNCQIARLQNLQDSDGGKDRLRVRVEIDASGVVVAAEIAKSSGNPQIDEIILAGIKQMQFQPSGKLIKGIIRANIFL